MIEQQLTKKNSVIKSISYSQEDIIRDIINLHLDGKDIECDPTYSKGVFYKNINRPVHTFDLTPQDSKTIGASCTDLPLMDKSIGSIMFDPPFVISQGPSLLVQKAGSNIISSR